VRREIALLAERVVNQLEAAGYPDGRLITVHVKPRRFRGGYVQREVAAWYLTESRRGNPDQRIHMYWLTANGHIAEGPNGGYVDLEKHRGGALTNFRDALQRMEQKLSTGAD
jgi:hypothetical protein